MKKLVALLLVAVMSIAAFGALAESTQFELTLSKDPSEYKILIYWPAPDTYFEDNIQPGYQAIEEMYGITVDYVIGTEWTQDVENQMVQAKMAEGYDLFMVYGADTSGANALYQEMIDFGCTVVNYGGVMNDPQVAPVTVCGDVYDYSYNATKKMIEDIEATGEKAVIIDVGINRTPEGLCGDADFAALKDKVAAITPVPGGVGPMTIAMLLKNTVQSWQERC